MKFWNFDTDQHIISDWAGSRGEPEGHQVPCALSFEDPTSWHKEVASSNRADGLRLASEEIPFVAPCSATSTSSYQLLYLQLFVTVVHRKKSRIPWSCAKRALPVHLGLCLPWIYSAGLSQTKLEYKQSWPCNTCSNGSIRTRLHIRHNQEVRNHKSWARDVKISQHNMSPWFANIESS